MNREQLRRFLAGALPHRQTGPTLAGSAPGRSRLRAKALVPADDGARFAPASPFPSSRRPRPRLRRRRLRPRCCTRSSTAAWKLEQLFPDSKTFADAEPLEPPARILAEYRAAPPRTRADLATFVAARFRIPSVTPPVTPKAELKPATATSASVEGHIASLWPHLTRAPEAPGPWSSALPLAHQFVVPGGRFREIYYWDSYFTMLGLSATGIATRPRRWRTISPYLIEAYGHVPNGTRSYYLSRSQPPFFYLMVGPVADDADAGGRSRLPELRREYACWMQGPGA